MRFGLDQHGAITSLAMFEDNHETLRSEEADPVPSARRGECVLRAYSECQDCGQYAAG
jgi:hypothetical protein